VKQHHYDHDATGHGNPRDLVAVLFDFEALPGRYPLTLRKPGVLFERSRDVLLLASGRAVKGLALNLLEVPRVQRAACFFVRTALLRPGADHYTLLGLEPGFQKEAQRDHYRMLIRLTHPDFAGASGSWPIDAATRINQANDVLASVISRAEYDQSRAIGGKSNMLVDSLAAILPRPLKRQKSAKWRWVLASIGLGAFVLTLTERTDSVEEPHLPQVAILNSLAPAIEIIPVQPAKVTQMAKDPQAAKVAQAAKSAQASKVTPVTLNAQESQMALAAKSVQPSRLSPEVPVAQAVVAAVSFKSPVNTPTSSLSLPVIEPTGRPSLVDVQPALNQLIQAMQAGRGEELLHGLDRSLRQSRGVADLVSVYNILVGSSTAVRLGPVQLRSRPSADQLAVDGVVQLVLQDQGSPSPVRELRWRALFSQRDGQVVMTELSAGGFRP